jgi:hypothetical protein
MMAAEYCSARFSAVVAGGTVFRRQSETLTKSCYWPVSAESVAPSYNFRLNQKLPGDSCEEW